jgi:hypothetical protein
MDLKTMISEFRCKEKVLPHYFGRMAFAYDIVNYGVMEGKTGDGAKKSFRILFFGGTDVKHLIKTVADNSKLDLEFHLYDSNPHIQVRFGWCYDD